MIKLCAAVACVLALPAGAAQWKVVPQVALGADTDTNRRLQRVPTQSESAVFAGTLAIARLTEVSSLAIAPRATVSRYSGEDALDSNDWGVNTSYRHNGEKLLFDFSGSIADDSTLVTELGETGFVEGNTRRRSTQASMAVTQYLGPRHLLQYQVGASDIDYDQTVGTGLVGYRYPSASLLYAYTASPRLDVTVSVDAARLDAPDAGIQSDTRGAQLGLRFRASERFDLELRSGRSNTSARGRDDSKQSFRGSLAWHDELSKLELSLSREVEPSGRGILVNADDLRLAYSRELGERLTLDTSARVSRREDLQFALRSSEYRYAAATLALSWKLDDAWTLGLAGLYARQEFKLTDTSSDGRRFGFTLAWRPWQ
jgi:hypothetical protein